MSSPNNIKEVQHLTGRIAALHRLISIATNKCLPFFSSLHKGRQFQWIEECEHAFQQLKAYLHSLPFLSKAQPREQLTLYLVMSDTAISSILMKEVVGVKLLIYYVSKVTLDTEIRYINLEKFTPTLLVFCKKV